MERGTPLQDLQEKTVITYREGQYTNPRNPTLREGPAQSLLGVVGRLILKPGVAEFPS